MAIDPIDTKLIDTLLTGYKKPEDITRYYRFHHAPSTGSEFFGDSIANKLLTRQTKQAELP